MMTEFEKILPKINKYHYKRDKDITSKGRQEGFDVKTLENMARSFIIDSSDPEIKPKIISYAEFVDHIENNNLAHMKAVRIMLERLKTFTPKSKPIMW
jgi:hypothetical protein